MKKYLLLTLALIMFINTQSQEFFISTGKNFTKYDYKNDKGNSNPNIENGSGSFYELGTVFTLNESIGIAFSLTLDEFNATGGNNVNSYTWDTSYLGVQGVIKYGILSSDRSNFSLYLNAGVNLNHIISGNQKINGQTFGLTSSDEFKGLFVKPLIGIDARYYITNDIAFGLGYSISKNFGLLNTTAQKLNFNNNQIQFNLIFSIN